MADTHALTERIVQFCQERDWEQFHSPKDLALSLTLEASELMEHFQWKGEEEIKEYVKQNKTEISEELADVFYWVLLTSYYLDIDLERAFQDKMSQNESKYPAKTVKGKHNKYTEYEN